MISREEGKNTAGRMLIEKFGKDYLVKNKEKLSLTESLKENILKVAFYYDEVLAGNVETADGGISVDDSYFPKHLLSVSVNLLDGEAKIVEE